MEVDSEAGDRLEMIVVLLDLCAGGARFVFAELAELLTRSGVADVACTLRFLASGTSLTPFDVKGLLLWHTCSF